MRRAPLETPEALYISVLLLVPRTATTKSFKIVLGLHSREAEDLARSLSVEL